MPAALSYALRNEVDPERPLFVFLNIADAHWPWADVPAGISWVPATRGFSYSPPSASGPWRKFYEAPEGSPEREAHIENVTNLYDWGVLQADQTTKASLETLRSHGWLGPDWRLVLTSDHGEYLGEQGLIDHGNYLHQPNQAVPIMLKGTSDLPPDSPLSALAVHELVLGASRNPQRSIEAVSGPHATRMKYANEKYYHTLSAAIWAGDEKLLWMDGRAQLFDLRRDPSEQAPMSAEGHPLCPRLEAMGNSLTRSAESAHGLSEDLTEQLKAIGYAE